MTLNHLNLTVTDVRAASAFLERYFGLSPMGGNAGMAGLRDDGGMVLTLMKAGTVEYPGTFHVGFFVSREAVDEVYGRMREDGLDVAAPAETGHSYGFYVRAPGGFTVEVGA